MLREDKLLREGSPTNESGAAEPAAAESESTAVEAGPAAVEAGPAAVGSGPAAVEAAPAAVEAGPAAVEAEPAAVEGGAESVMPKPFAAGAEPASTSPPASVQPEVKEPVKIPAKAPAKVPAKGLVRIALGAQARVVRKAKVPAIEGSLVTAEATDGGSSWRWVMV